MQPAVVYLSRWANRQWSRAFLNSVAANPAGADHDLILVLKGYPEGEGIDGLAAAHTAATQVRISDDGFDINAYLNAAARCSNERMLFFNSYSRILAPNWLASYLRAFDAVPKCGVVAAT